jgi:hypothetical protein
VRVWGRYVHQRIDECLESANHPHPRPGARCIATSSAHVDAAAQMAACQHAEQERRLISVCAQAAVMTGPCVHQQQHHHQQQRVELLRCVMCQAGVRLRTRAVRSGVPCVRAVPTATRVTHLRSHFLSIVSRALIHCTPHTQQTHPPAGSSRQHCRPCKPWTAHSCRSWPRCTWPLPPT